MVATETEIPHSSSNISECSRRVAVSFSSSWPHKTLLRSGSARIFEVRPGEGFGAISSPEAFRWT
jgi:hypothetical protein